MKAQPNRFGKWLSALALISAYTSTNAQTVDVEDAGFYETPSSFIEAPGSSGMQWRYEFFSGSLPSGWETSAFNDSSWNQSTGGIYTYNSASAAWVFEPAEGNYV